MVEKLPFAFYVFKNFNCQKTVIFLIGFILFVFVMKASQTRPEKSRIENLDVSETIGEILTKKEKLRRFLQIPYSNLSSKLG